MTKQLTQYAILLIMFGLGVIAGHYHGKAETLDRILGAQVHILEAIK